MVSLANSAKQRVSTSSSQTVQKMEEERKLPNSSFEASIALLPKPDKDTIRKRKSYGPISLMNTNQYSLWTQEQRETHTHTHTMWFLMQKRH